MMRRGVWLSLALGLALVGARTASAHDYWDLSTLSDDGPADTTNDLFHGTSQQHDLQAAAGPVADEDWYIAGNYAQASYEAVIDGTGGDVSPGGPPLSFDRIASDGVTVLQSSEPANIGLQAHSRSLRWQSSSTASVQWLRVRDAGCTTSCGSEDQYHIGFYETTVSVPRFNNASGQVTVLIIQNSTGWANRPIAGTIYFWNTAGTLLGSSPFILAAKASLVLNTGTVAGVAGTGGTITVAHDGGYGNLAMKAVALEPATGFSFDTPGSYKPL